MYVEPVGMYDSLCYICRKTKYRQERPIMALCIGCYLGSQVSDPASVLSYPLYYFICVFVPSLYPDSPGFSFASWFGYAFPQMVILLMVAWVWLQLLFIKIKYVLFVYPLEHYSGYCR